MSRREILGRYDGRVVRRSKMGIAVKFGDGWRRCSIAGGDGIAKRNAPNIEPVAQKRQPSKNIGSSPAKSNAQVVAGRVAGNLESESRSRQEDGISRKDCHAT